MRSIGLKNVFVVCLLLVSALCFYFFYAFYLRHDFDESGRAFDAVEGVTYSEANFVWGIATLVFAFPAILQLFKRVMK